MEHPIFFLTKLLEVLGLGHFAHAYPHVTFTWLIMLLLIIFGWIATKAIQLVPYGGQNLFEAVIDGVENFQVEVMGEHGRVFFPMIATLQDDEQKIIQAVIRKDRRAGPEILGTMPPDGHGSQEKGGNIQRIIEVIHPPH